MKTHCRKVEPSQGFHTCDTAAVAFRDFSVDISVSLGYNVTMTNINDMGTTGLVDFVLDLPNGRVRGQWNRIQKATAVIRRRYGAKAIPFFCKAVWAKLCLVTTNISMRRSTQNRLVRVSMGIPVSF